MFILRHALVLLLLYTGFSTIEWENVTILRAKPETANFGTAANPLAPVEVFANYSWLSSQAPEVPISIAETEFRGITIAQLSALQLGVVVPVVHGGAVILFSNPLPHHIPVFFFPGL